MLILCGARNRLFANGLSHDVHACVHMHVPAQTHIAEKLQGSKDPLPWQRAAR